MNTIKIKIKNNGTLEDIELFNNSLYVLYSDINNICLQFPTNEKRVFFVNVSDSRAIKLSTYIKQHNVSQKQMECLLLDSLDVKYTDINDASFGCQLSFVIADQLPENNIIVAGLAGLAPKSIAFTALLCEKLLNTAANKLIILLLQPGYDITNNLNGKYLFYKIENEQLVNIEKWLAEIQHTVNWHKI